MLHSFFVLPTSETGICPPGRESRSRLYALNCPNKDSVGQSRICKVKPIIWARQLWRFTGSLSTLSAMQLATSVDQLEGPITRKEGSTKRDGVTEKWNFYSPGQTFISSGMLPFTGAAQTSTAQISAHLIIHPESEHVKNSKTAALTHTHRLLLTCCCWRKKKTPVFIHLIRSPM